MRVDGVWVYVEAKDILCCHPIYYGRHTGGRTGGGTQDLSTFLAMKDSTALSLVDREKSGWILSTHEWIVLHYSLDIIFIYLFLSINEEVLLAHNGHQNETGASEA